MTRSSTNDTALLRERLHQEACAKGEENYIDPSTGFMVFTRLYHEKRGYCCKSGCRHCPWGYKKDQRLR